MIKQHRSNAQWRRVDVPAASVILMATMGPLLFFPKNEFFRIWVSKRTCAVFSDFAVGGTPAVFSDFISEKTFLSC